MSENNQNNHNAPENEKKESKGSHGRRNHYRPHKGHRPRQQEGAEKATAPEQEKRTTENTPVAEGPKKKPHSHSHNQNRGNRGGQRDARNGENEHKSPHREGKQNGARGMRGFRQPPEKRPYDPYEAPSKEEIALSELRAQIVLKAADGSVPTAYTAPSAPAPKKEEPTVKPQEGTAEIAESAPTDLPNSEGDVASASEAAVEEPVEKVEVIGIRFRSAGKMYYFDPHGIPAKKGDCAIVETTRGPEFGEVCLGNTMIRASETVSPLRPLIRIATPADIAHNAENREKEKEALLICQEKIRAHGLEMKLIDVQYAFDNSKLLFYFAAEGRVDFRELVKDLASVFRTRIELRQIGIRDEAKMLGGIGACGRALCCSTFLPDFAQVSIKMAKEQNLSLNSTKISGVCGRLMCCLRYEADVYTEEIRKTPPHDALVKTEDGIGTVISSNPLAGTIRVLLKDAPDTPPKQYHRDSVTLLPKEKKGNEHREHDKTSDEK